MLYQSLLDHRPLVIILYIIVNNYFEKNFLSVLGTDNSSSDEKS